MAIHNADIAAALDEIADLLELEETNPFRVRAYCNAARRPPSHHTAEPGADLPLWMDAYLKGGKVLKLESAGEPGPRADLE